MDKKSTTDPIIENGHDIIEVRNLTKKFKSFVAVDSVNLKIKKGELFGLLGPNGAGKTTLINMLSTILYPSSGDALINGHRLKDQDKVRNSIGMVFQDPTLDDELTARENLDIHGSLYHMPREFRKKRIEDVLDLVDLKDKAEKQIKTFSGGMKRRLEIARGMMHTPKILFLDEPTLGLDPQTRRTVWEHIEKLNKEQNLTIILTTHYLEEADYLCDRIGIIDHGKIVALDTPENLKKVLRADVLFFKTKDQNRLAEVLTDKNFGESTILGDGLNVSTDNGDGVIPEIFAIASKNGIKIDSVTLQKSTLEDVFIHYTGRKIREEEASAADGLRAHLRTGRW
ncbi:MAG TPA: ATP-binding cassette domain-containing protein [Nitrosopumilaceae archaeon]|nr:ATP-binding cassette domain-containing protein [Nitrosopumilaceae archaeon]